MRTLLAATTFLLVFPLFSTSCAPQVPLSDDEMLKHLRSRAAFDMHCPVSGDLRTVTIDDRSRGVWGCGQRAVYVESCASVRSHPKDKCTWVLDANASDRERQSDAG